MYEVRKIRVTLNVKIDRIDKKMRCLMILLGVCLMACNRQFVKQEGKTDFNITEESIEIPNGSLTKGEQESLIEVLSPYLEVNTAYAKSSNKNAEMISKALDDVDFDENYQQQNILHVDSVIKQCIVYVRQNEPKLLLDLFDKEKMSIYCHPSNTWLNEQNLHYMILSLYQKYYRPLNDRMFAEKMIELYEFSLIHVTGLELFGGYSHPDYIPLIKVLVDCYSEGLGNYEKAIELQRQACERLEQEETEGKASKNYGFELIELARLYLANNDTIRMDSCNQILRKNPYIMEKYFQEHK